ncbi:IS200/IS605 family transposase [Bacteroides sp.]
MSTYTQIIYHIVFSTKNREKTLTTKDREHLYKYIWGFIRNKKCQLYRINGMEDHLHLLIDLRPDIALSDFIRDLKTSSSAWIKKENVFPTFSGWQPGYGAFTYAIRDKELITNYIKDQEKHHAKFSFIDEYRALLTEAGISINEQYFP